MPSPHSPSTHASLSVKVKKPIYPSAVKLQVAAERAFIANAPTLAEYKSRELSVIESRPLRLAIRAIVSAVRAEMMNATRQVK